MRATVLGVNGVTGRAIALDLAAAGWDVVGTGRDESRFPTGLRDVGVTFVRSDRRDAGELAALLGEGADVVVDCVCYTADDARLLVDHRRDFGSAVVLSSKAVYVDDRGRHSNSDDSPDFGGPVAETQGVLEPDFSGDYRSREGYGANKVAAETVLQDADVPVSILRPSRIHGTGADPAREWFVVKRLLDGRRQIPLAHGGFTGNHPTAATNLARLVRLCAEKPGDRTLNAADPGSPTARDVILSIAAATGIQAEVVPLCEDVPLQFGASPWGTWPPFFLDTSAAAGLGFEPVGSYAATVTATVSELLRLDPGRQDALTSSPYFADGFDYALDDAAVAWSGRRPAEVAALHPLWRPFAPGSNVDRQSQRIAHRQTQPGALRPHDPSWAADFDRVRRLIEGALPGGIRRLTHVGSTAIPGVIAKPVIDVDLVVDDVSDEMTYVPQLEAVGFRLIFRDDVAGDLHRQLTLAAPNTNLHVWSPSATEPRRHELFVTWLASHSDDRQRYSKAKGAAAANPPRNYNDAKAAVVYDIYERAFAADPLHEHTPQPRH